MHFKTYGFEHFQMDYNYLFNLGLFSLLLFQCFLCSAQSPCLTSYFALYLCRLWCFIVLLCHERKVLMRLLAKARSNGTDC